MTDLTVTLSKTIHAPVEQVFDAWLDPKMLTQFILPMPGMPQPEVQNDAKKGGDFSIIMQVGDQKIPHTGRYLEISRPSKLVFSWFSPFSPEDSCVTLMFTKVGDSETHVELTHVKFIDEQSRSNHEGGWGNILMSLEQLLG